MSPIRVTYRRTLGLARTQYTTILALAGFLAATAALFAFALDAAEGHRVRLLVPLWSGAVAPVLPILAAVLGMDVWSDERRSGRIDLLLASPVRERDLVIGKFLGVWTMTTCATLISLVALFIFVGLYAARLLEGVSMLSFLPGFLALALQGALWSAVAVAVSAFHRNSAAAAFTTVVLLVALPRGLWYALLAWAPEGRTLFGEMPLDAQVFDMSQGLVSTATVVTYLLLIAGALFLSSKRIAALRFGGRGGAPLRRSTILCIGLAGVLLAEAVMLAYRLDATLDIPVGSDSIRFSDNTKNVLAESQGVVTVTAFLERKDPRFREVSHFLRALAAEADAQSGVRIELRYVDPVLDIGAAQRLVRANVARDSLVFESRGRIIDVISLAEGYDERSCASVIERLSSPIRKSYVYWTTGHGEASFDDWSPVGMSTIARYLMLDGYGNRTIDLAGEGPVPDDCALIVIAGARDDFSELEMKRLRSYLDGQSGRSGGGRVLVLLDHVRESALKTLLSEWGVRPVSPHLVGVRTLSGSDVIVSDFAAEHVISSPFAGHQVVLDRPIAFERAETADQTGAGVDRKRYSELMRASGACLAAAVERGGVSSDLALRPTRLVAIGDLGFVLNGRLVTYANANRDFFLNGVKYLSGRDVLSQSGVDADRLVSGMDRHSRVRFVTVTTFLFPGALLVVLGFFVSRRRRR